MSAGIADLPQWVGYALLPCSKNGQTVLKPNGKPKMNKIPMNPRTGTYAKVNNPATWSDYETAVGAVEKYGFDGIGFVFTEASGIVGIDLDDCVLPDGSLNAFSQGVLEQLHSYAEYSPSGDGIHILVRGRIPRCFKSGRIEMYDRGRFFTYTGQRVPGFDLPIKERQAALDRLVAAHAKQLEPANTSAEAPAASVNASTLPDDRLLLEKAMQASNGAKFSALWRGDAFGYASQSEADSALCHMLAFWTSNDATAIDRLFRQSGLMREKWDDRHYSDGRTYGQQTIQRAIANTAEAYDSGRASELRVPDSDMPVLPQAASLDPALGRTASRWLDAYVDFSRRMSPRGYDDFHEAVGLWMLSAVAARRLVLQLGVKTFSTNLYIALCAFTTLFAKTTTARIALEVLHAAELSHMLMPNDATPAAFINQMVARVRPDYADMPAQMQQRERLRLMFPSQRGWFYEEFGTKVQAMMRDSGIMGDFRGILRIFDDNLPTYEYVTMTRRDVIERPYLALLANLTPADIRPFARPGAALWQDGFWARWAFITPPADYQPDTGRFPSDAVAVPNVLTEPLQRWHASLGIPQVSIEELLDKKGEAVGQVRLQRDELQPCFCHLASGVEDAFYTYHNALISLAKEQADRGNVDLIGNYGRLAEKAMRIAVLLASLENENRLEMAHWARAQSIAERWRANLHHLASQVSTSAPSEERRQQEKIVALIERHGPSTSAEIARHIRGLSGPEVEKLCGRLVESGVLEAAALTVKKTRRYGVVAA